MLDLRGAHSDLIMIWTNVSNIYGISDTYYGKNNRSLSQGSYTAYIEHNLVGCSLELVVKLERDGVDAMALVG